MEHTIGKTKKETILIDEEDLELVKQYTWSRIEINGKIYIRATNKTMTLYLHRHLMGDIPKGMVIDHINGNTLDNRKSNLRVCTHAQNRKNSDGYGKSKYKGLSRTGGGWQVAITIEGRPENLGWYKDEIEAATAYNDKCKEIGDEYFRLNVIDGYSDYKEEKLYKNPHKSKYKGITLHKQSNSWWVRCKYNDKYVSVGLFKDEILAARAYNDFLIKNGIDKPLNEI